MHLDERKGRVSLTNYRRRKKLMSWNENITLFIGKGKKCHQNLKFMAKLLWNVRMCIWYCNTSTLLNIHVCGFFRILLLHFRRSPLFGWEETYRIFVYSVCDVRPQSQCVSLWNVEVFESWVVSLSVLMHPFSFLPFSCIAVGKGGVK